jgi:hypothetical protein
MRRMTPLEAVFEILRSEGVERVFGNPGTTELPFLRALAGRADLTYVLGLHEGSVVSMADGYARATGRVSFVNLHVAAGVANGLLGMLNASRSRTPMVITAGQQDRRHLFSDPMLSGDLTGMAAPATKSAIEVQHAYDLPLALRRAFAVSTQPPTGPVFVSLPMDLLDEQVDLRVEDRSPRVLPGAAAGIDEVAARLIAAERPAIVAGDGVGRERGVEALVRVAAALGAAVYHQPMYDGINFPTDHPQYCGMLAPVAGGIRETLDEHDVVLLVGVHAFMAHHYTPGPVGRPDVVRAGPARRFVLWDRRSGSRDFAVIRGDRPQCGPEGSDVHRRVAAMTAAVTSAASRADGAGDRADGAPEDGRRVVSERDEDDRAGARAGQRAQVVRGMVGVADRAGRGEQVPGRWRGRAGLAVGQGHPQDLGPAPHRLGGRVRGRTGVGGGVRDVDAAEDRDVVGGGVPSRCGGAVGDPLAGPANVGGGGPLREHRAVGAPARQLQRPGPAHTQ